MKTSTKYVLLVLILISKFIYPCPTAFAEENSGGNASELLAEKARERFEAGQVREDFLIPTSPAFAVLGVTPEEVIRPDTPKALGAALLNGVDSEGNLQSGVAIDFTPVYLFNGRNLKLEKYRESLPNRLANRLQVALATTKGSDENDQSLRLAMGFRLAILDDADPRTNKFLDTCYDNTKDEKFKQLEGARNDAASLLGPLMGVRAEIDKALMEGRADDLLNLREQETLLSEKRAAAQKKVDSITAEAKQILENIWTNCNTKFEKKNWNATNFTVGLAPIFFSKKGDFGDLDGSGIAVYGTFSYGFDHISGLEDSSQLILHARYRTNEQVANPSVAGSFIEQDLFVAGGQLRIAGPDIGSRIGGRDLTFFGEIDYRYADPEGQSNDSSYRYALGMDLKIMEGTTLSLTVGDESGDDVGRSRSFAVGNLKWGF